MRIRNDESGQVLILTALSMTMLFGFLALAVDVGTLFDAKRRLQVAADAAATAGALDYSFNGSTTSAQSAAKAASSANGVTNGTGGAVVTANLPPTLGYHKSTGYVEVIVTQPTRTFFMGLFNLHNITITARAVAGSPGPSNACVYILDPSADDAMELQGSFDVSAPKCGVVIDSSASDALQFTGAGGTLTAGSISVVGGDSGQTGDSTPAPVTGATPVNNPFPNLTGPTPPGGCTYTSTATSVGAGDPSIAAGGVVCYTKAVTLSNVTLASGIYVFESGVTLGSNITSGTGGTTLDVYSGAMSINTGTTLALVAPSTGSTKGIALMEPATNSNEISIQKGDASGSITGIIFAPSAELYLQDSGGDKSGGLSLTTDLIVGTLFDKTATLTINSYSQAYPTITPLTAVSLVE
jgi:hypothetical protein